MRRATFPVVVLLSSVLTGAGCKARGEPEKPTVEPVVDEGGATGGDTTDPEPANPTAAGTLRHPGAPVEFDVPEGWQREQSAGAVSLLSPAEDVMLLLLAVEASNLDAALEGLDAQISAFVQTPVLQATQAGELAGMPAMFANGTGTIDGTPVDLGLVLVQVGGTPPRILITLGLAQPGTPEPTAAEVTTILQSIRPASDDAGDAG